MANCMSIARPEMKKKTAWWNNIRNISNKFKSYEELFKMYHVPFISIKNLPDFL